MNEPIANVINFLTVGWVTVVAYLTGTVLRIGMFYQELHVANEMGPTELHQNPKSPSAARL